MGFKEITGTLKVSDIQEIEDGEGESSLMLKTGRGSNTSNYSLQLMIKEIREPSEQSPCNVVVHCKGKIREMASRLS